MNAGIDRFSFDDRDNVKRSKKELRISDPLAKEILDKVARKAFVQFITRSRGQRDRLEAAKELKKMVFFSNIVVAALLEDVQVIDSLSPLTVVFQLCQMMYGTIASCVVMDSAYEALKLYKLLKAAKELKRTSAISCHIPCYAVRVLKWRLHVNL